MKNSEATLELLPATMSLQPMGASEISTSALADFHEGMQWMETGEARRAVEALTRCVAQAPAFTAGHICLGVAHAVSCAVYQAIDHLEKATELEPRNFAAQFTLAQFYFKLRVPIKGYEHAELALNCAESLEQRRALAQLLKKERERESSGISRPWFNREFGLGFRLAAITGLAALAIAVITFVH